MKLTATLRITISTTLGGVIVGEPQIDNLAIFLQR
jgi:hypothetical protein